MPSHDNFFPSQKRTIKSVNATIVIPPPVTESPKKFTSTIRQPPNILFKNYRSFVHESPRFKPKSAPDSVILPKAQSFFIINP